MKNYNQIVASNIKIIRQNFGFTQNEFAAILGKSLRTLQKYETGEISISVALLGYLADLFYVDIADFFVPKEIPNIDKVQIEHFQSKLLLQILKEI